MRRTITVNYLSEQQMQTVRDFLDSPTNRHHKDSREVFYGNYIQVKAEVKGDVLKKSFGYHDVIFEIDSKDNSEYAEKRNSEREQVISGLMKLLSEVVVE